MEQVGGRRSNGDSHMSAKSTAQGAAKRVMSIRLTGMSWDFHHQGWLLVRGVLRALSEGRWGAIRQHWKIGKIKKPMYCFVCFRARKRPNILNIDLEVSCAA